MQNNTDIYVLNMFLNTVRNILNKSNQNW